MIQAVLRALVLALAACTAPASAQQTTQGDVLAAEVLPGWRTERGTQMIALHFALAPGWKTYWRSPGEAGIPPLFDWSGSENLAAVRLHWPRPHAFTVNGMQSIGYKDDLVLPIELTPRDPAKPVILRASVDLGVCLDICMPASLTVSAMVDGPGASHPVIAAALSKRPRSAAEAGVTAVGCTIEPISDGLRVTARIAVPPAGGIETVVFEPAASIWVSEAVASRSGGVLTASADFVAGSGDAFALDRSGIVVTVIGSNHAVEIVGCPAP